MSTEPDYEPVITRVPEAVEAEREAIEAAEQARLEAERAAEVAAAPVAPDE
jgi:hypothetical protein